MSSAEECLVPMYCLSEAKYELTQNILTGWRAATRNPVEALRYE